MCVMDVLTEISSGRVVADTLGALRCFGGWPFFGLIGPGLGYEDYNSCANNGIGTQILGGGLPGPVEVVNPIPLPTTMSVCISSLLSVPSAI